MITFLPEHMISIDDESAFFKNEKAKERTRRIVGFNKRYQADPNTTMTDLGEAASRALIDSMHISPDEIQCLIFVHQSPDFPHPNNACLLHGRLNLSENCACFDINLGCSGFVYALWVAYGMIESKAVKNVLLVAGDISSRSSFIENRIVNPLCSDGASATFIKYTAAENKSAFMTGTAGQSWDKIVVPAGGCAIPIQSDIADKII